MVLPSRFEDLVQPFQIEALGLRGRFVRLGPALDAILAPHRYPEAVAEMMGETLALTAALANALRFQGEFKLQTEGNGPLSLMVADVTHTGDMRGYARFDADGVAAAETAAQAPVPRLLGAGRLTVTVDHGPNAQRYQGITELTGPRIADCAHHYFRQSEPLETAISLAATHEKQGPARSAALMIQRLAPEDSDREPFSDDTEDDWRKAVVLTSSVTTDEMLDPQLRPAQLLYRLYHEDGVRLFRTRRLRPGCRCSRQKAANTLAAFSRADLDSMVVDGKITVTCEFCKKVYDFDRRDLDVEEAS